MSDLKDRLARLGLAQYTEVLAAEGFETWDTVLDITESDLSHLSVKLGHRRKLQRAIAESRGQSYDRPLPIALGSTPSVAGSYRSDDSGPESKSKQSERPAVGVNAKSTKRKYRRHPKVSAPDEHAPERPPSAYVIFSNQVRDSLKGQDLTFTEIAKVVGEKWQVLPPEEREACERQANSAKERYYAELAEYKKTPQFELYQKYLEDFKAKHAAPTKEGKRSKLETETSTSTRSSSHDQLEHVVKRRPSSVHPDLPATRHQASDPSPQIGPARLPTGHSYPSMPTSPATHSHSGFNSPHTGEHLPYVSTSPRSAAMQREVLFDTTSINSAQDRRRQIDTTLPYQPSAYNMDLHHQPASTTPPSYPYGVHYQAPGESSSRRSMRESTHLPSLSHEDTTLSSESGHSGHSLPLQGYPGQALLVDPVKTLRMLPQPVPSRGPLPSPLDRPPPPSASSSHLRHQPHDHRTQGPLAALIRAGEIVARVADDEIMGEESSP